MGLKEFSIWRYGMKFYTAVFIIELVYSYLFWNSIIRWFRDLYYYSLSITGLSVYTAMLFGFFIPPFLLCFCSCAKYINRFGPPIFIIGIFFSVFATVFEEVFVRSLFGMFGGIFFFMYADTRLQSEYIGVRKRFISTQNLAILATSVFKYATIGYSPTMYTWYYSLIVMLLALLAAFGLLAEDVVLKWVKVEGANFKEIATRDWVDMKKFEKSEDNQVIKIILSILSNITLGIGFGFIIYLTFEFCASPAGLSNFVGITYDFYMINILMFTLGIVLSSFKFSSSPLLFFLVTIPSIVIIYIVDSKNAVILFGCLFILTMPSYIEYFFYEFESNFIRTSKDWVIGGAMGLSSSTFVLFSLAAVGCSMYIYLPLFGPIFGGQPWIFALVGVGCLLVSHIFSFIRRIPYSDFSIKQIVGILLFPHHFDQQLFLVKEAIDKQKNVEIELEEKVPLKTEEEEKPVLDAQVVDVELKDESVPSEEEKPDDEVKEEDEKLTEEVKEAPVVAKEEEPASKYDQTPPEFEMNLNGLLEFKEQHLYLKITYLVILLLLAVFIVPFFLYRGEIKSAPYHTDKLRIATFNIYQGYSYWGIDNAQGIIGLLQSDKVDVVGFQETGVHKVNGGYIPLVDHIAAFNGMNYNLCFGTKVTTIGVAFASRLPIVESTSHSQTLPFHYDNLLRPMCINDVVFNNTVVRVVNVHIDFYTKSSAELQVQTVLDVVSGYTMPHIILGDFNYDYNSTVIKKMIDGGYKEAFHELYGYNNITWHGKPREDSETGLWNNNPTDSIDFIFYRGLNPIWGKVHVTDLSDHYPVIIDFELV